MEKRRVLLWLLLSSVAAFLCVLVIGGVLPRYPSDPVIQGKRLSLWVNDLKPPGYETAAHTNAVLTLQNNTSSALPALTRWAQKPDSRTQDRFYRTLDQIQDRSRLHFLDDYYGAYCTRAQAAHALGPIAAVNTNAIGPLCVLLRDPVDYVREEAAAAFLVAGPSAGLAKDAITSALADHDGIVQERCNSALERLYEVPALAKAKDEVAK